MKTNKIVLIIVMFAFSVQAFPQLTYTNNGMLGIRRTPSYNLDVEGTTRLNGYVGINGPVPAGYPLGIRSYYGEEIRINPGYSSSEIGASTDKIDFWWNSTIGHNSLYAHRFYQVSDIKLKSNIMPITEGLNKVMRLKGVQYNFKNDSTDMNNTTLKNIGFIAQELEGVVPEAISESHGYKMIDYNTIIPLLVEAIKEQQSIIEDLNEKINSINEESSSNLKSAMINSTKSENENTGQAVLYQNKPNPFMIDTEINFYIPDEIVEALICLYDLQGIQIKRISIENRGHSNIKIFGSELQPGMYLYTLMTDGREIDTKRMILTD